jgi:penicillin-binding protein 1C
MLASTRNVPLRAKVDGDVHKIYWFAGKKFIGQAGPNEFLGWDANAGDYEITALDDHGRAASRSVIVH